MSWPKADSFSKFLPVSRVLETQDNRLFPVVVFSGADVLAADCILSAGKKLRSGSRRTWPRSRFLPGRDVRTGANRRLFPLAQCFRQTRNMCQGTIVTSPAANYLPHAAERSLQSWNSIHHQLWIDRLCAITVECCSRKK